MIRMKQTHLIAHFLRISDFSRVSTFIWNRFRIETSTRTPSKSVLESERSFVGSTTIFRKTCVPPLFWVGKLSRIALYESSEERRREEIGRLPYIRILYFLQVKSPFFVGTLEENYGL